MSRQFSSFVKVFHRDKDFEEHEIAVGHNRIAVVEKKTEVAAVVVGKTVDAEDEVTKISGGCRVTSEVVLYHTESLCAPTKASAKFCCAPSPSFSLRRTTSIAGMLPQLVEQNGVERIHTLFEKDGMAC